MGLSADSSGHAQRECSEFQPLMETEAWLTRFPHLMRDLLSAGLRMTERSVVRFASTEQQVRW